MNNMRKKIFLVTYILFFISQLLLGSVFVGPLTVRNIMTVIMFAFCMKEKYYTIDKYFILYICFMFFFLVSSTISGDIAPALKKFVAYYFVCYVAYQSTKCMIMKYKAETVIINTLLLVGVIDAIVTMGQFFGNPYAIAIFEVLGAKTASVDILTQYASKGTLAGVVVPGLVGGVENGYLLSGMCALAFYNKKAEIKLYNLALVLFFLTALLMVQERTGLVVAALIIAHMLIKYLRKKINLWVVLAFVLVCVYALPIVSGYVSSDQFRFGNLEGSYEARTDFINQAFEFLRSNPCGSIYEYGRTYEFPPHNFILNAFVYAGLFGAPFILLLVIIQLAHICPILFKRISIDNQFVLLFGYVYVAYTLNSLTHNASLVTGDPMFWISWAFVVCYRLKENDKQEFETYEACTLLN